MSDNDKRYAYYRTPDNTIGVMELQRYDPTSGTLGHQLARIHADIFGFELIDYTDREWSNSDWDDMYAILESQGYYTAERRAELFDI